MARVENALVREFNQVGPSELTQQDNDALSMSCIMMMKGSFDLNIIPNPSAYIPTLDQMLRYNEKTIAILDRSLMMYVILCINMTCLIRLFTWKCHFKQMREDI